MKMLSTGWCDLPYTVNIGANVVHEARITKMLLSKDPSDASLDWYFRHLILMPFLQTARVSDIFQQMIDYGKSM